MSESLRVNIWRDKFTSDHLRVNHLSKLSTLSEPSIVKFIENQSEHLSKFVFKKISMIDIPKSSKLHRYVNKVRKLYHARYKCNNKRDPKIINLKWLYPRKLICCLSLAGIITG